MATSTENYVLKLLFIAAPGSVVTGFRSNSKVVQPTHGIRGPSIVASSSRHPRLRRHVDISTSARGCLSHLELSTARPIFVWFVRVLVASRQQRHNNENDEWQRRRRQRRRVSNSLCYPAMQNTVSTMISQHCVCGCRDTVLLVLANTA